MRQLLGLFLLISSLQITFAQEEYYYQVQEDDSLTVILYSLGIFPVWDALPKIREMNNIQENPDYILTGEVLLIPTPNPAFAANYKILADGEVIILNKIITQEQKEEFLRQRGLKENVPIQEPEKSTISFSDDDELFPRQVQRIYLNFGFLLTTTSVNQTLPDTNSVTGTNSLETLNIGTSLDFAIKLRHIFHFNTKRFMLPAADNTSFNQTGFTLNNLSYLYGLDLDRRFKLICGLNYQERVFFTEITQDAVTIKKAEFIAPSLGLMYLPETKFFGASPRLMSYVISRPKKIVDNKEISAGMEYNFFGGLYYNLDSSSHIEFSAGGSYLRYQVEDIDSTELSGKFVVKYGREFFF